MGALLTADLHFSENPRDAYRLEYMPTVRSILKQRKCDLLMVLGDLTEQKDRHNAWLVNRVVTEFHRFAKICPVVIVPGNHDWHADAENPYFSFLRRIPGITWVTAPTYSQNLPIPPLQSLGKSILLPFSPDPEKDWKSIKFKGIDYAFCHQPFEGATGESGHKVRGTRTDIFPPWVKVWAGDIHGGQDIGPVTYIGAPYTIDFGDDYDPRMIYLERGGCASIPCVGPQKRLIDASDLTEVIKQVTQLNKGDIVKIRVLYDPALKKSWAELKAEIRMWAEEGGFIVDGIHPKVVKSKARKIEAKSNRSDEELLRQYAAHRRLDESMLKTGLFLLRRS